MTLGGISLGLNSALARINSIESNFQALNNIAFEIDLKQNSSIQNTQGSDFKTILDGKINAVENKNQTSENILPVYEDEITPLKPEEILSTQDDDIVVDELEEIEKDPVSLKSKMNLQAQNADINEIVETFSNKYGIDSDFIKAIIKQESGFNPKATSKKGAMGLMQLMPATAKSLGVEDAYNPWENVEGGVRYLKNLLSKYDNNEELALAAYNAGSGAVQKYGGIPPYKETQNYVKSIMAAYTKAKEAKI